MEKMVMTAIVGSDGTKMLTCQTCNMDSAMFRMILEEYNHLIHQRHQEPETKCLLLLDGAKCHNNRKIHRYLQKHQIRYLILPPYSPILAPIEHAFGYVKNQNLVASEITNK